MSEAASITVLIPTPLRRYTNGAAKVDSSGTTIAELLTTLESAYPGLGERIRDEDGQIRRFVNIFVNGVNARELAGASTPLQGGEEVGIIPAMAGGTTE